MSYVKAILLPIAIVMLVSCKLETRSSEIKTDIVDSAGNLIAHAAVTTLSFRQNEVLPTWERDARMRCGDKPYPHASRLDDLAYELIPESEYQRTQQPALGDFSTCRYQPPTPENMRITRDLFANKALAIKLKYPPEHANQQPPMIRFNQGSAINIPNDRFASLFIGSCSSFAVMNGINFCKTTDRIDNKVIWVALIAPMASGTTTTATTGGKGGIVVQQQDSAKGVKQVVEEVEFGKGGKGGAHAPSGARIDMNITLPWVNGDFNLSVDVPSFNPEIVAHMQGGTGLHIDPTQPVNPTTPVDMGKKLDRDKIAVLIPRPLSDPRGSNDARMLRLTLKTTPSKPHAGRFGGFLKTSAAIVGGVASVALGITGVGLPAAAALAATGGLSLGSMIAGIGDFRKWHATLSDRGYYDDFMVPADKGSCPTIYGTHLTFSEEDLYFTFKAERRHGFVVDWWDNLGKIRYVTIASLSTNYWGQIDLDGFIVYYCRKSHEKHCTTNPDKLFADELKENIANCSKTSESALAEFGKH